MGDESKNSVLPSFKWTVGCNLFDGSQATNFDNCNEIIESKYFY